MARTAAARRKAPQLLTGRASPRLSPPVPANGLIEQYRDAAKVLEIDLMPWQEIAARYLTARSGERWTFRSVCVVVARQNGKTTFLDPRIVMGLRMGRRMIHTAQNRAIPRETFLRVAAALVNDDQVTEIRFANGQEVIKYANGGRYTLVAPNPNVRGNAVDDIFIDEVRQQKNFELIAALKPTMTAAKDPQIVYLSNAGDESSAVLNDLRARADTDRSLAYLEWSASPDRPVDDRAGWAEANPALGTTIQLDTLEDFFATLPGAEWETEHLCRWVITMAPRIMGDDVWQRAKGWLEKPKRPAMGISVDPSGTRASAAIAWRQSDGTIGVRVIADVHGAPINIDVLGPDLNQRAMRMGATDVVYDPWTDAELAKHFNHAKAVIGREFANNSGTFVSVAEGQRLRWDDAEAVGADLPWTARKAHESGAWMAVKAKDDKPITAILAAIRAVGMAAGPITAAPRVF